jgi:hypothetical protein
MVRQYGLTTMRVENALEAICDFIECRVPSYPLELALAFAADTPHRMQQSVGLLLPFRVPSGFHASESTRDRVRWISCKADDLVSIDLDV